MFFIDDQKAKIPEHNIFRKQPVSADQDIDLPFEQLLQNGGLLLFRTESRKRGAFNAKAFEAIGKRAIMLLGKNGGRDEYRDLLFVKYRLHRRAHGYFGLAVSDVTANEAIHRMDRLHIALDLFRRTSLIWSILIQEGRLHFTLYDVIETKGKPLGLSSLRIELDKIAGDILEPLFGALFRSLPFRRAQFRKLRSSFCFTGRILGEAINIIEINEQHVVITIDQSHHFLLLAADLDRLQTHELANAFIFMHQQITTLERT